MTTEKKLVEKKKTAVLEDLPGKDCGSCGAATCEAFAQMVAQQETSLERCIFHNQQTPQQKTTEERTTDFKWKDNLGRKVDFVLDKLPHDPGPRESILLFNPTNVEKLHLKKGDILFGRPAWISCGCPVTHVGMVVDEPDYFNGTLTWCVVGPLKARENGINIGYYNAISYQGIVKQTRVPLEIGRRYNFLPRYCVLQWRHSGIINFIQKTEEGPIVRIEGFFIS